MEFKVVQIGNSGGIIIPRQTRRQLRIRIGEKVSGNIAGDKLIITNPKKKSAKSGINTKFARIVDQFMDEHNDVLQELARR